MILQYAQMESCRTMPETGNNILQCIGGPPKNPTGARCLGDNLVGSISQGLWQHRLSYLSVNLQENHGFSNWWNMMKHDIYKPTDITNPHGNHVTWWLLDSFGLHQLLQFWCWPCSVLATLGCRLAAARPGDWLEATKGLSTLVICVSAARWSVSVSLSSLCNRDYVV